MISARLNPKLWSALSLGLLLALAAVLFCAGFGRLPLVEPDEGRNAEVAREMLVSGDWITPHYNSLAYLDKPAVFFWMVASSMKVFGVSETAARLPSALMGLATVLLVWFLARRMFGEGAAWRSGLIFAACPLAFVLAREVIFDMTLTFLVTLALTAFWLAGEAAPRRGWLSALMFAAMGVAVITKGFVGILIPLGAVFAYIFLAKTGWRRWPPHTGRGILLLLAIALPWFIAVSIRNPDFPRYAFWNESLKRFATGASRRGGGYFYYLPVLLGGFFPWSLFLLMAAWNYARRWRELRQDAARPLVFLLCWAAWVVAFFTVSHSKLPTYFLPAIVPLSIVMGRLWQEVGQDASVRAPDWLTAGFALLLGIGVLVAAASQSWIFVLFQPRLARVLERSVLTLVPPSLLYTGLILVGLGYLGRRFASQRGAVAGLTTLVLVAAVLPMLVLRWYGPLRLYVEDHSSRRIAATILASPERDAPTIGYYYFRTGLPFYLRRPVRLLSAGWGEMTSNYQIAHQATARRELGSAAGQGVLLSLPEFLAATRSNPQPILVMVPDPLVADLWHNVGRLEPEWSQSNFSVWEIPPAPAAPAEHPPEQIVPLFQP